MLEHSLLCVVSKTKLLPQDMHLVEQGSKAASKASAEGMREGGRWAVKQCEQCSNNALVTKGEFLNNPDLLNTHLETYFHDLATPYA